MPIDNPHHFLIRPSPNSSAGLRIENQRLKNQAKILQETSAFHATFILPLESDTINLTFLNPALKQEINANSNPVSNYLGNKLRSSVVTHNWNQEPIISLVTSVDSPESDKSKVYGFTIEKMGNNQYHLTGRNITDKEIIRQQKEYERTHDSVTGYLNRIGAQKLFQEINQEKREKLKAKEITMFYIDLARVKEINNTQGHDAGDKYIIDTFDKITKCFRKNDIFIRINNTGDELIICLPNIDSEEFSVFNQRLNSLRQENPSNLNFYFGSANGFPDSTGQFDFSNIINQADLKQKEDKITQKSII
jgi:diguanylate cyclase (GGDEF)-like protein